MVTRISACAAVLSLLIVFCSCSASRSHIGAYVQGSLDSMYLNKNSEEYLEMVGSTVAECEKEYEQYIRNEVEYFEAFMDISNVSDETYQRMADIFKNLYSKCRYEVGEVTKSSDRYLVSVTVYPIDVISKAEEEKIPAFEKAFGDKMANGKFDKLSDLEREELWADGIISAVGSEMDNLGYLEPVTISLQVIEEEDGYILSSDDLVRMDELVIQY